MITGGLPRASPLMVAATFSLALHAGSGTLLWLLASDPPYPAPGHPAIEVTLVEEPAPAARAPAASARHAEPAAPEPAAPSPEDMVTAAGPATAEPPPRDEPAAAFPTVPAPPRPRPARTASAPAGSAPARPASPAAEQVVDAPAAADAGRGDPGETAGASRGEVGEAAQAAVAVPGWRLGSAGNPPPRYPPLARRHGWEGVVELAVAVAADGRPVEVALARSSGRDILDRAALDAVRAWRFEPARAAGRPVAGNVVVPIRFRLTEE